LAHSVIEILSDGNTPRWLSEGLAIHVAGGGAAMSRSDAKPKLRREELERKLSRPAPAKVMRELYAAAYREVLTLIKAEGEGKVWRLVTKAKSGHQGLVQNHEETKRTKDVRDYRVTGDLRLLRFFVV
jgi:hypothetical protein